MHISEHRKIELQEIDASILERITEDQVCLWLAARLAKIRESGLKVDLYLACNFRNYYGGKEQYYDADWTMHGYGEVAMSHKTIDSACEEMREIVAGNPREKAAAKRREAQRLLREAEDLAPVQG